MHPYAPLRRATRSAAPASLPAAPLPTGPNRTEAV